MNGTLDLFDPHPLPRGKFDGADYEPKVDAVRLTAQLRRVYDVMKDGQWRSVGEIARLTEAPETSVSAQLRNLRKEKFGSHTVERQRFGEKSHGFSKYRLVLSEGEIK